ncbi:MAG: tetratricopeptide repeat protein, partial [Candidatus Omnitrophota bacterium]
KRTRENAQRSPASSLGIDLHTLCSWHRVIDFTIDQSLNLEVFASAVIVVLTLAYALFAKSKNKIISFFILWFYITIFPVAQIVPFGNIVAEHYTYLPSIGFCCLLGYGFHRAYQKSKDSKISWLNPRIILMAVISVCLFYLYQTVLRNYDWRTNYTIWASAVRTDPFSPTAHVNLGNAYAQLGHEPEAEREYLETLNIQPFSPTALNSLGALYARQGRSEEALALMDKAIRLAPENSLIYSNIGRVYNLSGEYAKAVDYLRKAQELNPGRLELYYDLGLAYLNNMNFVEAEEEFNKVLWIDPAYAYGYYGLGLVHYKQGNEKQAEPFFQKAISLEPNLRFAFERIKK